MIEVSRQILYEVPLKEVVGLSLSPPHIVTAVQKPRSAEHGHGTCTKFHLGQARRLLPLTTRCEHVLSCTYSCFIVLGYLLQSLSVCLERRRPSPLPLHHRPPPASLMKMKEVRTHDLKEFIGLFCDLTI